MPRERRRDDEREPEKRDRARGAETDEKTAVDWERGSGGIEPGGDAVPRPRPPRVSESTPSAEAPDPDEAVPSGDEETAQEQTPDPRSQRTDRSIESERRYGAASRRQSGDVDDDRRRGRDERSGGDRPRASGGESTRERVGRPGNRRSRVGDADTGSPRAGSQRGSERETGVAGRVGGQYGDDRTDASGDRPESDAPDQFGGRRGGDRRDRRYGSRRGHGTRRRDRRTE